MSGTIFELAKAIEQVRLCALIRKLPEFWWWTESRPRSLRRELFVASAISLICLGAAFLILGPQLNAKFGLTDDHQILTFMGEDNKLSWREIPSVLFYRTEVGRFGEAKRYRPVYYLLRLIETSAWGLNARAWYATRIFLFAFFFPHHGGFFPDS